MTERVDQEQPADEARKYVRSLPDNKRRLFSTWAIASRLSHIGTDFFGNRLTAEERRIWSRVMHETQEKIETTFQVPDDGRLGDFFDEHHMKDSDYLRVFEEEYYNL